MSEWVEAEAEQLLAPLGPRWLHVEGVVRQARSIGHALAAADRDLLVAAAYAHDIGYAPSLAILGFHPLDGARYVARAGYGRLAGVVAHHSGAKYEATLRGLEHELAEFADEQSDVTAALAYCDLTTGPDGQRMTPNERLAEIEDRHGPHSVVVRGLRLGWPELLGAAAVIEERLATSGVALQPR